MKANLNVTKPLLYLLLFFATISLIISSCSKKEVVANNIHSGGVYIQCDEGPYFFSIDSLIQNCSLAESLNESVPLFGNCIIDSDAHKLVDIDNFDFKVTRAYRLEWANSLISQKPVEAKTVLDSDKYPSTQFYNGYEIQLSENEVLTLLFFNAIAAGCWHDVMVWEYVETE